MQRRFVFFVFLLFTVITTCTQAQVYRYTDSDGVITYSDQPQLNPETEAVTLPKLNISKSVSSHTQTTESVNTKEESTKIESKKAYTEFFLQFPADKQNFHNITELPVIAKIDPALQSEDTIQFFMDGKPLDNPGTHTSVVIHRVTDNEQLLTRGTHQLKAIILDKNKRVIKQTPEITIYLHYAHV